MPTRIVLVLACLSACAELPERSQPHPAETAPIRVEISAAACFGAVSASCPSVVSAALAAAGTICRDAGGRLGPEPDAEVWILDVDRDGARDYLFDLTRVARCEGANSVFSCGSLGCPLSLYRQDRDGWRLLGSIDAPDPRAIRVTASGDLRVGCAVGAGCVEQRYYRQREEHYELTHLMVLGHRVEVADSVHGLFPLTRATDLLDVPAASGSSVGRYRAGVLLAVIGSADGYYYVSPCNACRSGFVKKSLLERTPVGPL